MKKVIVILLSILIFTVGAFSACNLNDWTADDEIALSAYENAFLDGIDEIIAVHNMQLPKREEGGGYHKDCREDRSGKKIEVNLNESTSLKVSILTYLDDNHEPQLHDYYLIIKTSKLDTIEECFAFLKNQVFIDIVNYLGFSENVDMEYIENGCQKTQEMLNKGDYSELTDAYYSLYLDEKLDDTNECRFELKNDLTKMKEEEKYRFYSYMQLSKCPSL